MKTAGRFLWQWALSSVVLIGSSRTSQVWYHRDTDLHILNMLFSASEICPPKPWVQESWIHRRKERVKTRQQKKKLQQTIRIYFFLPVNLRKMWYYFDTKNPAHGENLLSVRLALPWVIQPRRALPQPAHATARIYYISERMRVVSATTQLCSHCWLLLCSKIFPTCKIIKLHIFNARLQYHHFLTRY